MPKLNHVRRTAGMLVGSAAVYIAASCAAAKNDSSGRNPEDANSIADVVADLLDGPPDAKAEPVGGTRLKPLFSTTKFSDGAMSKTQVGWHDTKRKEDCVVQIAADGKRRCMPSDWMYAETLTYQFLDPACTKPLIMPPSGWCVAKPPKFFNVARPPEAPKPFCTATEPTVRLVPFEVKVVTQYNKSGSTCTPTPTMTATPVPLDEIPASEFVEATVGVETGP